jgi:Flp pilus assembly protein TadD, contains TPR repeats
MRKIIVSIFLVLTFLCSPAMSITAADWFNNAKALWNEDEGKFTDPQKAIGYLNNAIKLQPNYANAYNNRGNAYADLRKYQQAIEDYNQAIRVQPDYAYAYINRGDAYYGLGQYQRAIEDCNEAIRLKPDNAIAYSNRGKAYAKLGQYEPAIKDFNEAIRLHPDDVNAYNNRGVAYLLQGNNDLGCRDAQKTCKLGLCKVLEWSKGNGNCLQEQSWQPGKDEVKITPTDASVSKSPGKQPQLPIENVRPSVAGDQTYKGIMGIVLMNGNKIEGQIISMNSDTVKIRTKDGNILSYDFKEEVKTFITE